MHSHIQAGRAAAYIRVSTTKQADADLSLPDQQAAIEAYCAGTGLFLSAIYVEPGASATDDNRPELQKMIEAATSAERPYDVIVVHSLSRFFRDLYLFELYRRRLEKVGVKLLSITQNFSDDPSGDMMRKILATFDEYQSKENGKHTLRAMRANAAGGFWNGAIPPFGYKTYVAETRGAKAKKKLMIDEAEAQIVRLIFDLYLVGDGRFGPLGLIGIVQHLTRHGHKLRGKPFQKSTVHALMTRETYAGTHYFNQRSAKGAQLWKPKDDWVAMEVPAIVEKARFEAAQAKLSAHRPKNTPPRIVNSPTFLAGLIRCAGCTCEKTAGMILVTGKSGRYRYYACSRKHRLGAAASPRKNIPMEALDELILSGLEERILQPQRLMDMLSHWAADDANGKLAKLEKLARLKAGRTEAEGAVNRLYALVERGHADLDDSLFANKLKDARVRLAHIEADTKQLNASIKNATSDVSPEKVTCFAAAMKAKLRDPDPAFRKAYLKLLVDRIDVFPDRIIVQGSKTALAAAVQHSPQQALGMVPSFGQRWRPLLDSKRQINISIKSIYYAFRRCCFVPPVRTNI